MESKKEKVVHISREEQPQQETPAKPKAAEESRGRDMGKAAVFIAILTILLLVVFFYALNRNMAGLTASVTGLTGQMQELTTLRAQVAEMDGAVSQIQEKMPLIDAVPTVARRAVLLGMVQDLSQRMEFIAKEAETAEQSAKLLQAKELLDSVRLELAP